jgi:uncharacterized protein (TIGR03663 family)
MTRRYAFATAVFFLTAVALSFRLPSLGNRPFHGDEAVHAFKFRELWEHGSYHYDPNEFHGPTIYYAALPAVALSGHHKFADTEEGDYRFPIALFGTAMIPLLLLFRDGLGKKAMFWAGLLFAVSPAFVFYSRYYIQEMLLAFFTLAFFGCLWRYRCSDKTPWLVGAGASAGLMIASKETALLSFVAAGIAWLVTSRFRRSNSDSDAPSAYRLCWRAWLVIIGVAVGVAYIFLSGFFTNLAGPFGYLQSYTPWLRRAGGTNLHKQSFSYYLSLLSWHHPEGGPIWSEGLILVLAALGAVAAFSRRVRFPAGMDRGLVGFTVVFTVVLTLIYSAIPYKTPWCVLSFLGGMILLAGVGAAVILDSVKSFPVKTLLTCLILAGSAQLGWQAYRTSFLLHTDGRNPYVYAQPVPDVVEFKKRAEELANAYPQKYAMVIKVISVDEYYWPLPWYLRRFDNVGYYTQIPPDPVAPLVFVSPEFDEEMTKKLENHIMTGFIGLRPGVPFETFVQMPLWERYLKERKRPE